MANGNQSGFGTPGTQQTAQKNVKAGGVNPYMPVGRQLAKQGASSYQKSLVPGGPTPGVNLAKTAYGAAPPPLAKPSPLTGFPYKEALGMNASLGFSNEAPATMPGYVPGGGGLESSFMALTTEEKAAAKAAAAEAVAAKADEVAGNFVALEGGADYSDLGTVTSTGGPAKEKEEEIYGGPTEEELYKEFVESDQPGFDPEEYAKMQQDNIDDAEMMFQEGLQALSRQYAMMGMTGAGAHMVANNAWGAQVHEQLVKAQNALSMANQIQIEEDMAEKFDKGLTANESAMANALKAGQLDLLTAQTLGIELTTFNDQVMQNAVTFMDHLGHDPTDDELAAMFYIMQTADSMGEDGVGWAMGQFQKMIVGEAPEGYEGPYAEYVSSNQDGAMLYLDEQFAKFGYGAVTAQSISAHVSEHGQLPQNIWKMLQPWAVENGLTRRDVTELFGVWEEPTPWGPFGDSFDEYDNKYSEDAWDPV